MEIGSDAGANRPVLHVVGKRRAKAQVVQGRRTKLPDQMVDILVELLRDFLERVPPASRVARQFRSCP